MKRILLFIIAILIIAKVQSHPWKPDHYVIIETDCGLDDYRAINLMIESPNIQVLAIITSNGVVNAEIGYRKVKSLLKKHNHDGLLVGMNNNPNQKKFNCEPAINFNWGSRDIDSTYKPILYEEVLNRIFEYSSDKISYVNLGGLNSICSYFGKYPDKIDQIKEFIWTCDFNNRRDEFNYLLDTISYYSTIKSGIEISCINGDSFGVYTEELEQKIINMETSLANNIYRSLSEPKVSFAKKIYDESAYFYLYNKEIFDYSNNNVYELKQGVHVNEEYLEIINSNRDYNNQIFSKFPVDTSYYIIDVQNIMDSTILKYGCEEWMACVLTSELHRHLGVYSLIGAKMGVRAKEYFAAGIDEMTIYSYAGLKPPFSCLNDGLQVSTGATLGHGLISVDANSKFPKADFYYLGQKITISLKKEYSDKIRTEIKDLSVIYGLDSNVYWDLVRDLAIRYWSNWSRDEIFEIEIH